MRSACLLSCSFSLTLGLGLAACGLLGGGGKSGQAPAAEASGEPSDEGSDEEAGINQIVASMRDFKRALEAKNFDAASKLLKRAENGIKNASEVTRGHPDFEDVSELVSRQRPRLDEAIERDRIERRNAAIDNIIKRGMDLIERGKVVHTELSARVPTQDDLKNLGEVIDALAGLEHEGQGYLDEPRYASHAADRDRFAAALVTRRKQAELQLAATGTIAKAVETASTALNDAKKLTAVGEQLAALRRASDGLSACVTSITDLESNPAFDATKLVETRMGTASMAETKKKCIEGGAKVRERIDALTWLLRIDGHVQKIAGALGAVQKANGATETLAASEAAVKSLGECATDTAAAQRAPGADKARTFATALGEVTVAKLQKACSDERAKLAAEQPQWRWRRDFETMREGIATLKARIDETAALTDFGVQAERWRGIMGQLDGCVQKAKSLGRQASSDEAYVIDTAFGKVTVSALEEACGRERATAAEKMARAVELQKAEAFVRSCRGDEVELVRQEGVPTRIQDVDGGRVFHYERKGEQGKSFGFDTAGKAVDFPARWRESVQGVADEVTRVLTAAKTGKEAATVLAAVQEALPIMAVCIESLTRTEKDPGYDAGQKFTSALGTLSAPKLREACVQKKRELEKGMPALQWLVQLEQAAARATEATAQLDKARLETAVAAQVTAAGSALGGFNECIERAEALLSRPNADKKLTVASPYGQVSAAALIKGCKGQIPAAQQALDAALTAQKLEKFIQSCKGDEAEVARREGMPTRIEELAAGRIFVYEGAQRGAKGKRFAFDKQGKRVEERVLQP